jgi:hypothetical protein
MDKFLDTYNLPRINPETENLNGSVTRSLAFTKPWIQSIAPSKKKSYDHLNRCRKNT